MKLEQPILCSACLLGCKCRYDGNSKSNEKVLKMLQHNQLIPVCPEQLGGLSTPRAPSERNGDKVITKDGKDITINYQIGAKEVLQIAKLYGCKKAILKTRSPSCGSKQIYDGTFTGTLISRDGVCAELLKKNGIEVISEEDL